MDKRKVEEDEQSEEQEEQEESQNKEEDEEEEVEEEEEEEEEEDEGLVDLNFAEEPEEPEKPGEPVNIVPDNTNEANPENHITEQLEDVQNEVLASEHDNYDHIKDPQVRMLMEVKLEDSNKDDVVNMLMGNKALAKKGAADKKKPKGKKHFKVESHYKLEKLNIDPLYKTGNFHINAEKDNPEFTNDFGTATKKLLSKMKDSDNKELLKLLVTDKEKLNSEVDKLEIVNRDHIDNKVKGYLTKKQKNLEKIDEKVNEEFMQKHTFNPEIINTNGIKRNLEQFLNDQDNHNKRVQDKIKIAKDENNKKEIQTISESHPKIDEHSEKIFQEKIKTEDPTHLRLYKQKMVKNKSDALKVIEQTSNKTAKNKSSQKTGTDVSEKKEKKASTNKEAEEHLHNLYKSHEQKKIRMENLKKKIITEEEKGKGLNTAGNYSNKVFLNNVMEKYRKIVNDLFAGLVASAQNSSSEEHAAVNSISLNKLSLLQVSEVLNKFGFTEFLMEKPIQEKEEQIESSKEPEKISVFKENEKRLVLEIWEALKDTEGNVNVDHLFLFILAVIKLYDYYLYSSYKKTFKQEEAKENSEILKESKSNFKKDSKVKKNEPKCSDQEDILKKISADINSKIVQNNKYAAFDEQHDFLIPLEKARCINKDFSIFYINFMVKKGHLANKVKKPNHRLAASMNATYKPQINENSNRLYNEYRRKVLDLNNSVDNQESKNQKEKDILEYIDKLIIKKKNKQYLNLKLKEEFSNAEMLGCTFKPKINEDYHGSRENLEIDDRSGRWDKLYKMGIQIISNKKDKLKSDFDIEIYGNECTFKPNTEKEVVQDTEKIQNDIYNEKSYELLYSRLKNGRLERMIKHSVHERGEFPGEIEEYLNKSKRDISFSPKDSSYKYRSLRVKSDNTNGSLPVDTSNHENLSSEEIVENFNNEPEKKDSIPLLIIDVNIRPGVKKKIYVFDGDTSEGLAEKFAKEHNLDTDTKSKLQVLIQSHMSRLLMSIIEENQSVSEKSSTYNH